MQMIEYFKKIEAVGYAFIGNLSSSIIFYFFICQVPLQLLDVLIAIWICTIYCSFIHLLSLCNIREDITMASKIFQAIVGVFLGCELVIAFHLIAGGFHLSDFNTKVELGLTILIATEVPFFIHYLAKKI